jgi:hypothetical protein
MRGGAAERPADEEAVSGPAARASQRMDAGRGLSWNPMSQHRDMGTWHTHHRCGDEMVKSRFLHFGGGASRHGYGWDDDSCVGTRSWDDD